MKTLLMAVNILLPVLSVGLSTARDANERPAKELTAASHQIHWPVGFEPKNADAFVHNEIWIQAPAMVIWNNLITAGDWPG